MIEPKLEVYLSWLYQTKHYEPIEREIEQLLLKMTAANALLYAAVLTPQEPDQTAYDDLGSVETRYRLLTLRKKPDCEKAALAVFTSREMNGKDRNLF